MRAQTRETIQRVLAWAMAGLALFLAFATANDATLSPWAWWGRAVCCALSVALVVHHERIARERRRSERRGKP